MITLFANIKGGVGKSTLAVNLAVLRAKHLAKKNKKLLLIDADRQASAANWANIRSKKNIEPKIFFQNSFDENIEGVLQQCLDQYDEVIIDAGGADSISLRFALVFAHRLIVPIQSGQFEIWVLEKFKNYYLEAQQSRKLRKLKPLLAAVLVNMQSSHPNSKFNREIKEYLTLRTKDNLLPMNLFTSSLKRRNAFSECLSFGLAVDEMLKKDKKAITEIQSVYSEIWGD